MSSLHGDVHLALRLAVRKRIDFGTAGQRVLATCRRRRCNGDGRSIRVETDLLVQAAWRNGLTDERERPAARHGDKVRELDVALNFCTRIIYSGRELNNDPLAGVLERSACSARGKIPRMLRSEPLVSTMGIVPTLGITFDIERSEIAS